MEQRSRAVKISVQKTTRRANARRPRIEFYKPRKSYEKCTFGTTLPKNWVTKNFKDELRKYDTLQEVRKSNPHTGKEEQLKKAEKEWEETKKKSFRVNVDRLENVLIVSSGKDVRSLSSISGQDVEDLKNSLLSTTDLDDKNKLLYNWLVAKFVAGMDYVSLKELEEDETFLYDVVQPFGATSSAVALYTDIREGLDFQHAKASREPIRKIYRSIMNRLGVIDKNVRKCLLDYCNTSNYQCLHDAQKNLIAKDDKQIEITMWTVIRKICRQLDLRDHREKLANTIFYIVLAADAKLLERYKDNYLDIIEALINSSSSPIHCEILANLIEKTFNLLEKTVEILLESAYLREKIRFRGSITYRNKRLEITRRIQKIMETCNSLAKEISETGEKVRMELIQTDGFTPEKGREIWWYSRIFDRLHRHNKRVMNIAQSALFGLPTVESQ